MRAANAAAPARQAAKRHTLHFILFGSMTHSPLGVRYESSLEQLFKTTAAKKRAKATTKNIFFSFQQKPEKSGAKCEETAIYIIYEK